MVNLLNTSELKTRIESYRTINLPYSNKMELSPIIKKLEEELEKELDEVYKENLNFFIDFLKIVEKVKDVLTYDLYFSHIEDGIIKLCMEFFSITIHNSSDSSLTIPHLIVYCTISENEIKFRRAVNCCAYAEQYDLDYTFSHCNGAGDLFCFGNGHFSELLVSYPSKYYSRKLDYIKDLLLNIRGFISWESLEGVPYKKIRDIILMRSSRRFLHKLDSKNKREEQIFSFILEYLEKTKPSWLDPELLECASTVEDIHSYVIHKTIEDLTSLKLFFEPLQSLDKDEIQNVKWISPEIKDWLLNNLLLELFEIDDDLDRLKMYILTKENISDIQFEFNNDHKSFIIFTDIPLKNFSFLTIYKKEIFLDEQDFKHLENIYKAKYNKNILTALNKIITLLINEKKDHSYNFERRKFMDQLLTKLTKEEYELYI